MIHHNGALVFSVNYPEPILDALPMARVIRFKGKELVAVKHTLDASVVLRNLGLNAPTPILHDYPWPGRFEPMLHQRITADFICGNRRCFVLNSAGTGKTSAALWACDWLLSRGLIKRVLVVCPLSVGGVWAEEIFNTLPHRTCGLMQGKKEKRLDVLASGVDFCIINFDGLASLYKEERDKSGRIKSRTSPLDGQFDMIIADEASTYRNAQTNRYKALKHLIKADTRLVLMSATMTPNAPTDAWALCKLVSPKSVPDSFKLFQETVMRQAGPYKWVPKPDAKAVVHKAMQPAILFSKEQCLDLPPLTYNNRTAEMSAEQAKMFSTMRTQLRHEDKDAGVEVSAANAAIKILKLQQICCGVVKDDNGDPVFLNPKDRLNIIQEIVEECDEKVIVFVPFIYAMELVKAHLSKHFSCELVNGSVSAGERDRIFSAFQHDTDPRVLVAHPAVASHGLTLTAASTIIWYGPIYSLEMYEQANARIDRKGQTKATTVYHIGAHPFEWQIYGALRNKSSVQSALMNLYREVVGA